MLIEKEMSKPTNYSGGMSSFISHVFCINAVFRY